MWVPKKPRTDEEPFARQLSPDTEPELAPLADVSPQAVAKHFLELYEHDHGHETRPPGRQVDLALQQPRDADERGQVAAEGHFGQGQRR